MRCGSGPAGPVKDPALVEEVRRAGAEVWLTTGSLKGRSLQQALRIADGVITNHPSEALFMSPVPVSATAVRRATDFSPVETCSLGAAKLCGTSTRSADNNPEQYNEQRKKAI